MPSVVRLTRYVRVPYRTHVGLSRRAIFARDGGRCAYCRGSAETIDHVFPRSRGGLHAWENVVAACARCNHSKGDKTPAELGWRLHALPAAPKRRRLAGARAPRPRPPLGRLARPARARGSRLTARRPADAASRPDFLHRPEAAARPDLRWPDPTCAGLTRPALA